MSALWRRASLRARLLGSVAVGAVLALGGLVLAFNLVLASRLDAEANSLARAQAAAQMSALQVRGGQIQLPDAADARNPDSETWVFQGASALERPRTSAENDRGAAQLARARAALTDIAATETRLYAAAGGANAPRRRRRRRCQPRRLRGDAPHGADRLGVARRLRRAARPDRRAMADRPGARAGGDDDAPGLGVERTRPRPTLQPGRIARRARAARHHPQWTARTARREPPPRATPLGRDLPRAAHPAGERHRRGPVRPTPRHSRTQTLARILERSQELRRTLDALMAAARAEFSPRVARADAACLRTGRSTGRGRAARADGVGRWIARRAGAGRRRGRARPANPRTAGGERRCDTPRAASSSAYSAKTMPSSSRCRTTGPALRPTTAT